MVIEHLDSWVDDTVRLLPNIEVALAELSFSFGAGALVRRLVEHRARKCKRDNLGDVLGGIVKWMIILPGFLLAATIVIPSLKPGDLIAGLGVSSVAIGFAFKDILQNWLAGLLILLRQPLDIDDQIEVNGFEGTVRRIETRATIIQTYDGQRIVLPNSDICTNAVLVETAHEKRRSQYDVGISCGDGTENACEVLLAAINSVDEVQPDHALEPVPWDLAASWVTILVRWWTHSRPSDVVKVQSRVILAIKKALGEAGMDMPFDAQVQLFHDQSEADDGARGAQREGWPKRDGKSSTEPRWKAQARERGPPRERLDTRSDVQADTRDSWRE